MINREALKLAVNGALWFGKVMVLAIIIVGIIVAAGVGVIMLMNHIALSIGGTAGILASLSILILLFMILAGIAIYLIEAKRL